jgi:hypothetical protein
MFESLAVGKVFFRFFDLSNYGVIEEFSLACPHGRSGQLVRLSFPLVVTLRELGKRHLVGGSERGSVGWVW